MLNLFIKHTFLLFFCNCLSKQCYFTQHQARQCKGKDEALIFYQAHRTDDILAFVHIKFQEFLFCLKN